MPYITIKKSIWTPTTCTKTREEITPDSDHQITRVECCHETPNPLSCSPDQPVFITGDVVHVGLVWCLDFDSEHIKDMIPLHNHLYLLMAKQKSYEHKREMRAMLLLADQITGHSRLIPIDLETLVENSFVSPTAPE